MGFFLLFLFLPLLGGSYPPPLGEGPDPIPGAYSKGRAPLSFSAYMQEGREFQVNEEDYPGGFPQWFPDIVPLSDTGFVAVWMDERNADYDIYAQRFGGVGKPQGETIRVNDDLGAANQWNPGIASDGQGRWAVVWSDYRDGGPEIYAQIFDGGERLGDNFQLSQGKEAERYYPDVAGWKGRFLAVWEDRRDGDPDIYGQFFDVDFLVGENFRLNSAPRLSQRYPQVASSSDGAFFVVWRDYRKGPPHIFGQLVEEDGEFLGGNFWVDDDSLGYAAWYPAVAGDSGFVVGWEEWGGHDYDVFARRYDPQGGSIGDIIEVSQDPDQSEQSLPSVGAGPDGFLISWADRREGNYDIYAQRFGQGGNPLGENFRINDDQGEASQLWPAAAYGESGFCICWRDQRDGLAQVYAQGFHSTGLPEDANLKPGGDVWGAHQLSPALASDPQGLSLAVWEDYRWGKPKIYGQWFTEDGLLLDGNLPIQDRSWPCTQLSPQVAAGGKGRFSISWMEGSEGDWDVWLKLWGGASIKVNDQSVGFHGYPSLSYGNNGALLVCWEDWRGRYDIYCQLYDSDLSPVGSNFRINDEVRETYRDHPWVAGGEGFVTVWREYDSGSSYIYGQVFVRSAHPLGANFRVDLGQSYQVDPQVAFGGDDEFGVVWVSKEAEDEDIYAQWFNGQGLALTAPVLVNDDGSGASQVDPTIVGHQGEYIMAWTDYREGNGDIYGQKFKGPANRSRKNFRLHSDPGGKSQLGPSLSSADTLLLVSWQDTRILGDGWDIWAKLSSWQRTGLRDGPALGPVVSPFSLLQNYPNPFNSATHIRYHLPAVSGQQSAVSLKIYNILGQEVRTLVDKRQRPGSYAVVWDGMGNLGNFLPSGIYFYWIKAGDFTETKRMILLK